MSFLAIPFFGENRILCASPLISTTSLKVYYKMNNDATDSSGNGNNGTATSVTYTTGKFSNAAVFNGTTSWIKSATFTLANSTNYSIGCWFKSLTKPAASGMLVSCDQSPTNAQRFWQFRITSSGYVNFLRFSTAGTPTVVTNITTSTDLCDGNWHHIAAVFDSAIGSKIYVDGISVASDSVTTTNKSGSNYITVGAQTFNAAIDPNTVLTGNIDEAFYFERSLSLAEVQTLALGTCPLT